MDEIISCPTCHQPVRPTDYFCPNCGKNLRPAPLSTSLSGQISLYLKTLLLPPLGLVWGFRYLRQSDTKSKIVGLVTIIITTIEVIWLIQFTINTVNTFTEQLNQQTQLYGL
jgi:hypothetical protein